MITEHSFGCSFSLLFDHGSSSVTLTRLQAVQAPRRSPCCGDLNLIKRAETTHLYIYICMRNVYFATHVHVFLCLKKRVRLTLD